MTNKFFQDGLAELRPDILHCIQIKVSDFNELQLRELIDLLSESEAERQSRFHRLEDAKRFAVGRGTLRYFLGRLLEEEANNIVIKQNEAGKPVLENNAVYFNVSHSNDLVLIVFAKNVNVGVDIEHINPSINYSDVINQFFHPHEQAYFSSFQGKICAQDFIRCWSRKEAVVKAVGDGLAINFKDFQISCDSKAPIVLIPPRGYEVDWTLKDISVPDGYSASVACPKNNMFLKSENFFPGRSKLFQCKITDST